MIVSGQHPNPKPREVLTNFDGLPLMVECRVTRWLGGKGLVLNSDPTRYVVELPEDTPVSVTHGEEQFFGRYVKLPGIRMTGFQVGRKLISVDELPEGSLVHFMPFTTS